MRKRNWRLVIVGFLFLALSIGFFIFMLTIASSSTDPAALMQTVGGISGFLGTVSIIMIIAGLLGKKS